MEFVERYIQSKLYFLEYAKVIFDIDTRLIRIPESVIQYLLFKNLASKW